MKWDGELPSSTPGGNYKDLFYFHDWISYTFIGFQPWKGDHLVVLLLFYIWRNWAPEESGEGTNCSLCDVAGVLGLCFCTGVYIQMPSVSCYVYILVNHQFLAPWEQALGPGSFQVMMERSTLKHFILFVPHNKPWGKCACWLFHWWRDSCEAICPLLRQSCISTQGGRWNTNWCDFLSGTAATGRRVCLLPHTWFVQEILCSGRDRFMKHA